MSRQLIEADVQRAMATDAAERAEIHQAHLDAQDTLWTVFGIPNEGDDVAGQLAERIIGWAAEVGGINTLNYGREVVVDAYPPEQLVAVWGLRQARIRSSSDLTIFRRTTGALTELANQLAGNDF